MSTIRRMPEEVRALRNPWKSVAASVRGLTPSLERAFRAGQRVSRLQDGFVLGGSIKGGSSSVWTPVPNGAHGVYLRWRALEGFDPSETRVGFEQLLARLAGYGISLVGSASGARADPFQAQCSRHYPLIESALAALPTEHLQRAELSSIRLGGWGADGAKASGYRDEQVHLYAFALRGSRRAFCGLLLHELGHAQEVAFSDRQRTALAAAHRRIVAGGGCYGIDFVQTPKLRKAYQSMALGEFLAETYLAYAACGASLRQFILSHRQTVRDAWTRAYGIFREAFEGIEYA